MNNITKLIIILSSTLLCACVNQNNIAHKKHSPVSQPCTKIKLLIDAHGSGFEQIKSTKLQTRASNTWKAKYNIIGESCHIWTLGNSQTTYSCNITANDKATADNYYQQAQQTIKQCLGDDWVMEQQARKADNGLKTTFTSTKANISVSTHIVPEKTLRSEKWTIYYYIGNP